MVKLLNIFFCFLIAVNTTKEIKYDVVFSHDYNNALIYISKHTTEFTLSSILYKHQPQLITTIVFPELVRYSSVKDLLETSALELAYVNYGSSVADFSIGNFQMKPSFVENLEKQIELNDSLKKVFPINIVKNTDKEIRQERLNRLTNLKWQLVYLNCFVSVVQSKFKSHIFATTQDSIKFYASAYNGGYHKSAEQIITSALSTYFPYGANYKGKQYAYADVATYFHQKTYCSK